MFYKTFVIIQFIDWLIESGFGSSFRSESSKHCPSKTVRAGELKFWENDQPTPCVTCHVSHLRCQVSGVRGQVVYIYIYIYLFYFIYFFLGGGGAKVVELFGGGSVIDGAYHNYFFFDFMHIFFKYKWSFYFLLQIWNIQICAGDLKLGLFAKCQS